MGDSELECRQPNSSAGALNQNGNEIVNNNNTHWCWHCSRYVARTHACNPHNDLMRQVLSFRFTNTETEAKRGKVTCPRPHSKCQWGLFPGSGIIGVSRLLPSLMLCILQSSHQDHALLGKSDKKKTLLLGSSLLPTPQHTHPRGLREAGP